MTFCLVCGQALPFLMISTFWTGEASKKELMWARDMVWSALLVIEALTRVFPAELSSIFRSPSILGSWSIASEKTGDAATRAVTRERINISNDGIIINYKKKRSD